MKSTLHIMSVFTIAGLLIGCEREANIPLPQTDPVMVIASFISPSDTAAILYLSSSNPVFRPIGPTWGYVPIQNATVKLTGSEESMSLLYDEEIFGYKSEIPPTFFAPGKSYFITVEHPDFPDVSSSTEIPSTAAEISEPVTDVIEIIEFGSPSEYIRFRYDLIDPEPDVYNYYRVIYYEVIEFENNIFKSNMGSVFAEDSQFSGGTKKMEDRFYKGFEPWETEGKQYEITVLTVSEEYFRYHKTADISGSGGGPFAEPVIVFSNAEGGLGVFGGYLRRDFQVEY